MIFAFNRVNHSSGYAFGYDPTGRCHKREGGKGKDVAESREGYRLREAAAHYKALFDSENEDIGSENTYFRDLNAE